MSQVLFTKHLVPLLALHLAFTVGVCGERSQETFKNKNHIDQEYVALFLRDTYLVATTR